jgi:hypothetical protein
MEKSKISESDTPNPMLTTKRRGIKGSCLIVSKELMALYVTLLNIFGTLKSIRHGLVALNAVGQSDERKGCTQRI